MNSILGTSQILQLKGKLKNLLEKLLNFRIHLSQTQVIVIALLGLMLISRLTQFVHLGTVIYLAILSSAALYIYREYGHLLHFEQLELGDEDETEVAEEYPTYSWAATPRNLLKSKKLSPSIKLRIVEALKELTNYIQTNKFAFIKSTHMGLFLFLDITFAFLFLSKSNLTVYLFFSIFSKLVFGLAYLLTKTSFYLDYKKYFLYSLLAVIVVSYIMLSYSGVLVTIIFGENFTVYKSSLLFVFIAQAFFALALLLLKAKETFMTSQPQVLGMLYNSYLVILGIILAFAVVIHIGSIDGIALFVMGINLLFLTILYHLLYRIHIYIQLV
jgi:hypothetical protein